MRHELKHIISYADYTLLSNRLSKLFPRDKHADAHGEYRVRSLYFDTPGDAALKDKISGAERREKFRLRLYNEDTSHIRLEKKIKRNNLSEKHSAALTEERTRRILCGDIEWMRDNEALLIELYSSMQSRLLRPKVIVEYIREPFIYTPGNVRITLDRDIRTGLTGTGFLKFDTPLMNTFEAYAVLEIKYDGFIPDIAARAVHIPNRRQTAFSKYAVCRKYD